MTPEARRREGKRRGGIKGGHARARILSAKRLTEISLKANKARWSSPEAHKAHSDALKAAHARRRANAAKAGSQQ